VCRIWEELKNAHVGSTQVQARLFATYRREYENFTHLPGESIDAMFQRFTVIVNNMRANVPVLPYDDHDRAIELLHSWGRTVWSEKVEAILESEKYETLMVDEIFSPLGLYGSCQLSPAGTGLTGGSHRSDRCWSVDSRFGVPLRSRVGRVCVGS
jgi:hypothetical protein